MSSTYRIERDRGVKEYRQQLTELIPSMMKTFGRSRSTPPMRSPR
jgi:hypothetical protein